MTNFSKIVLGVMLMSIFSLVLDAQELTNIDPLSISEETVLNNHYLIDFSTLSRPHKLRYCIQTEINTEVYLTLRLQGALWEQALRLSFLSVEGSSPTIALVNDGRLSDRATWLISASRSPILSGSCILFGKDFVLRLHQGGITQVDMTVEMTWALDPSRSILPSQSIPLVKIIPTSICSTVTEIPRDECEALQHLYDETHGASWFDSSFHAWNTNNTPCRWVGIECTSGHVTKIDRRQQNLVGTLPDLSGLTHLHSLWLEGNQLYGEVPSSLERIPDLRLQYNLLTSAAWSKTQTVAPTPVIALARSEEEVDVWWEPIPYQEDEGYYQIKSASTPEGPYSRIGTTTDKHVHHDLITRGSSQMTDYFVVETHTLPHLHHPSHLISPPSQPVPITPLVSEASFLSLPPPTLVTDEWGHPGTISGNRIDLGLSEVGNPTTTYQIIVVNKGKQPLIVSQSQIQGDNDFILHHTPPFEVLDTFHTLTITCVPNQTGPRQADLSLITNDPNASIVTYTLRCEGYSSELVLSNHMIEENSEGGTSIGFFYGSGNITLIEDAGGQFVLSGNQLQTAPKSTLDFESQAHYQIVVRHQSVDKIFEINVVDLAEFDARIDTPFAQDVHQINAPEAIKLTGHIQPKQEHIGKIADLFALYRWTPLSGETTLTWPVTLAHQILITQSTAQTEISLFEGNLIGLAGIFEVDLGYQVYEEEQVSERISTQVTTLKVQANRPPIQFRLEGNHIKENSPAGTFVGSFFTEDPDQGEWFTYSIMDKNSRKYFKVKGNELFVAQGATLNFENGATHPITVRSIDASGEWIEKTFMLDILDEAENTIHLTNHYIFENSPGGTLIGRFYNTLGSCDYKLMENESFVLSQDILLVAPGAKLDFETQPSYEIQVQCLDTKSSFIIQLVNVKDLAIFPVVIPSHQTSTGFGVSAHEEVTVEVNVTPDVEHRKKEGAEFLSVALNVHEGEIIGMYRLSQQGWTLWDGNLTTLGGVQHVESLEESHSIMLFKGRLTNFAGNQLQIYVGYRFMGEIVYSFEPVEIQVRDEVQVPSGTN